MVAAESARLRAAKKLVLVLDLDHTLLNSVRITDVRTYTSVAFFVFSPALPCSAR